MTGPEHNDEFYTDGNGRVRTRTNRSGGIQGGISNGEIVNMRVAFKPTSTIGGVDGEARDRVRGSRKPMHFLSNFIAVDMDEKEDDEEEEKEEKEDEEQEEKKEDEDKEKEDEEEKKHARETIGRVALGALAKEILKKYAKMEILAYVSQVHHVILLAIW
ncbi:hypothetical protein AALP_AA4G072900 [Arabis alpina]|uniref:chorismate synthase n=1 Tax=Arabis alpina TaxID=50452 RepID=A0A087H1R0_ARAAL|nr:hypothetical protein AALP_AA4G072900 [Arabis alpina]